jgi:hypothetical protein
MTLDAEEFIWRFLLHVLPGGFVRIWHFGWLANAHCRHKLALCRELLGVHQSEEHQEVSILAANPRFWHDSRRAGSVANADNDARRIQELQVKGRFLDQVIGTMRKFRVRRIILV